MKNCFYYVSIPEKSRPFTDCILPFGFCMEQRNDLMGLRKAKKIVERTQSFFTELKAGRYVFTFGIALPSDDELGGWSFQKLKDIIVEIEDYSSETVSAGKTIQIQ